MKMKMINMDLAGTNFSMISNSKIHHHPSADTTNSSPLSITTTDNNTTTTTTTNNNNNSSVGSNMGILLRPWAPPLDTNTNNNSSSRHSTHRKSLSSFASDDALAQSLTDPASPAIPLDPRYEHRWGVDLRRLTVAGPAFAQGAFGKLYRGTYNGEDVAVKLLEKPENNPERARVMEQQFTQELSMLANLNHPNVVRFVGACRKEKVWCIVTEYARRGSVRQSLAKRKGGSPVSMGRAVRQALDVARGMAYVHGMGFIHRDLKSDNLLICGDKSIKIADFGEARIEVKTEGMTPETGTYRWMAP